jgi:hypothetical protein
MRFRFQLSSVLKMLNRAMNNYFHQGTKPHGLTGSIEKLKMPLVFF